MKRKVGCLVAIGVVLSCLFLLYFFNPDEVPVFPRCVFFALTGYHCAGCGTLRAIHCLLNGNVNAALAMNPLLVVSIPFLGVMLLYPKRFRRAWVPPVIFGILLLYGVFRNIPVEPFLFLAPK